MLAKHRCKLAMLTKSSFFRCRLRRPIFVLLLIGVAFIVCCWVNVMLPSYHRKRQYHSVTSANCTTQMNCTKCQIPLLNPFDESIAFLFDYSPPKTCPTWISPIMIINNNTEIIIITPRRAVAERAENIGIWFKILEMLAQLAVISNVSKIDPKKDEFENDLNFRPSSSPSLRTSSRSWCTSTSTGRGA